MFREDRKEIFLVAVAAFTVTAGLGTGAIIGVAPGNVTASSQIGGTFNRLDDYIVNGSGLSGGQHTTAVEPNMWLSTGSAFGGIDTNPFVVFDLGDVYTINSFRVWNYNEVAPNGANLSTRGVNAVTIEYGLTNAFGSVVPGISNFAQADATNTYAGEDFSGFTPFDARFIRFDIDSNHGDGNTFYGLSEVQFDGVLAIPEPGSLALFGFGGLLVFRRQRARS